MKKILLVSLFQSLAQPPLGADGDCFNFYVIPKERRTKCLTGFSPLAKRPRKGFLCPGVGVADPSWGLALRCCGLTPLSLGDCF
jgi:hypothetical protein